MAGSAVTGIQRHLHFQRVDPRLRHRIVDRFQLAAVEDLGDAAIHRVDGVELPVLDLQHQKAALRMQDHEIRL